MKSIWLYFLCMGVLFLSTLTSAQNVQNQTIEKFNRRVVGTQGYHNLLSKSNQYSFDLIFSFQNEAIGENAHFKWKNTLAYSQQPLLFANLRGEAFKYQLSVTSLLHLPLELPQSQKIIFNQKTKVWKPRGEDIIIGAVFAGLGAAAMLIPPFPDFKSDKVGPQVLFIVGGSTALVGTITMFGGIFHQAKVNQQPYDPAVSSGEMVLLSSAENNKALSNIANILQQGNIRISDKKHNVQGIPKQVTAFDDRIEIMTGNRKSVLSFKDLYICGITTIDGIWKVFDAGYVEFKLVGSKEYKLLTDLEYNLNFIRNQFEKQAKMTVYNDRLNAFKPLAAKYRSMVEPPVMSENQRKLVVQANTLTEQKQYDQAINKLNEALAIDPIAYPTGYTNLALLYARLKNYDYAILNIKKYLLLVPDAPDARESQDKIYEWELLLKE